MDGWWATTATTSIFIAAAITDWLDGYIARKVRTGIYLSYCSWTVFNYFFIQINKALMCYLMQSNVTIH